MKLSGKEKFSLSLFLLLITIIVMDQAIILPNQILIAADLGIDFALLGMMIGFYLLISGASTIFFGYLSDSVDRKRLILFSGFLWSSVAILHIFVQNFIQLATVRYIAAIATGVTTPVAFSYLADVVSSDSRSKAFAWWGLITTLGGLVAGGIALAFNQIPYEKINVESQSISQNMAYIIQNYSSLLSTWRLPFLYLGILGLIFTLLNFLFVSEPKRGASEKLLEEVLSNEELQYSYHIKFSDLKYIFKRKSNLFLVLNLFDVVASGILIAFIFPYINLEMGISFGDPNGLSKVIVLLAIAAPLGFIFGSFGIAAWADRQVKGGDITARIRVATICGILNLPFLIVAFLMAPNVRNSTFFFGALPVDPFTFWVLWIIFASLLAIGLAFTFGIAPNWYSSLIDVNLPEHRGTMIAMASFLDTIGRALGAIIGGIFIVLTDSISGTIFWATIIFGVLSTAFWIPLFYTCDKDFQEINDLMEKRVAELKEKQGIRKDENLMKEEMFKGKD